MEVQVCQLCKEPIANFACLSCLGKSIADWLPSPTKERFLESSKQFLRTFGYAHSGELEHKLVRSSEAGVVCLYCYINEVFQWLWEMDKAVAKRFREVFAFGMKKEDFREIIISHAQPITEKDKEKNEFGLCDCCGEYSYDLKNLNGNWVCEGCLDE